MNKSDIDKGHVFWLNPQHSEVPGPTQATAVTMLDFLTHCTTGNSNKGHFLKVYI